MRSPCRLLPTVMFVLGVSCGAVVCPAGPPPASIDQLRAARREAANRPRRLIFNNDGNEPVYALAEPTPLTAAALLECRTTALADTQVACISYCTWSSGFGLFTHGTTVGQVFSTKEGLFAPNRAPELLAAGVDPLRVMVDFAHRHGREIFWSLRMNDTHDGSKTDYGPIMLRANALKTAHPEWMIGSADDKPTYGAWTAVDYTRPEIRDLAFRYVEEVCLGYDVDGVELDFFRHPVFFRRAALTGSACDDGERAAMTELIRLGSADDLAELDKDYFASILGVGAAAGGALPHAAFVRVPTLNPASPIRIPPAGRGTTWFDAGRESTAPARVAVLIQRSPADMAVPPAVSLNGHALEAGIPEAEGWIRYAARRDWLRAGRNDVEVSLPADAATPLVWTDLRCTVRYLR